MAKEFDREEAKKFLAAREEKEKHLWESERKALFEKVVSALRNNLKKTSVEAYLIGSILKPFSFSPRSDIDIVLRNFNGDRFDFWVKMEKETGRTVQIILFETSSFKEFLLKDGFKATPFH